MNKYLTQIGYFLVFATILFAACNRDEADSNASKFHSSAILLDHIKLTTCVDAKTFDKDMIFSYIYGKYSTKSVLKTLSEQIVSKDTSFRIDSLSDTGFVARSYYFYSLVEQKLDSNTWYEFRVTHTLEKKLISVLFRYIDTEEEQKNQYYWIKKLRECHADFK